MPIVRKTRWLLALALAAGPLALPAMARATLVYVRGTVNPVVYTATDSGAQQKRLTPGSSPRISPDGRTVAFMSARSLSPNHFNLGLEVIPADGGAKPRVLVSNWRSTSTFAFSPDSSKIAAVRGPELGRQKLVLLDVATGGQRIVAQGFFNGVSFSPDGSELVYARAGSERYPPHSDLFRAAVAGGKPTQITRDHRSELPLWGPNDEIVFVKLLEAKRRRYGPKNELFLMGPSGGAKRLTHTKVGALLQGLFPTDWSGDGSRLLAEFGGQDTTYAVTVNPRTGAQKPLVKAEESGFVGTALSADGSTVLGFSGGFDPANRHVVATVPYSGGRPRTIVRGGSEPDWNR